MADGRITRESLEAMQLAQQLIGPGEQPREATDIRRIGFAEKFQVVLLQEILDVLLGGARPLTISSVVSGLSSRILWAR